MPKKYARELAFFRDIYDDVMMHHVDSRVFEVHNAEMDAIRNESDKKLLESNQKLAASDKKLLEANQKLAIKESSLRDYREMIKCKNNELDEYGKCVNSKNGELKVYIDTCRCTNARIKSLEKTNCNLLRELADAKRSQEPDSKKQKLRGTV